MSPRYIWFAILAGVASVAMALYVSSCQQDHRVVDDLDCLDSARATGLVERWQRDSEKIADMVVGPAWDGADIATRDHVCACVVRVLFPEDPAAGRVILLRQDGKILETYWLGKR